MFCTQCGKKLNDGAKFCPQCGAKVSGADKPNVNAQGISAGAVNESIPEQVQAVHVEEPVKTEAAGLNVVSEPKKTELVEPEKTEEIGSCDIAKPEKNEISKTDTINVPEPCGAVELKESTEDASADIKENEENTAGKTSEDEKGTAAEIKEVNENTGIEPKTETGVSTEHVTVEPYVCPDPAAIEQASKKSKKKLIIIIAAAVVLAAIIVVVVLLVYFNAPEQRLVKAVKEQDYNTAYTILTEETVKETDKTMDAADTVVQDILSQFRRDDINFEEAFDKLDALEGTPGAYAAEDAADRIETILEDEYEDNFRKLEEAGYLNFDEATEIIVDVKETFDYRSGYKDSDTWSEMISCALEGAAADTARILITIDEPDELAYEAEYDEYPSTRDEIGRNLIDYSVLMLWEEAGDDKEKKINCDLQEILAYSILDGTAPEDFSVMFEASNHYNTQYKLENLDQIIGTDGSGKVLTVIRSELASDTSAQYGVVLEYDDVSVVPLDNIPENLDDVEYIVLFYFDRKEQTSYLVSDGRILPGYQTYGYVSVIHCPTGETIYTSEPIWGPELEDTYYVSDSAVSITEDRPDLSVFKDEVLDAIGAGSVL